jgi:hypothetical protein
MSGTNHGISIEDSFWEFIGDGFFPVIVEASTFWKARWMGMRDLQVFGLNNLKLWSYLPVIRYVFAFWCQLYVEAFQEIADHTWFRLFRKAFGEN